MARRRRLTRREMKQDRFMIFVYEASEFIVEHTRELIILGVAVVIAGVAGYWYATSKQARDEAAARILAPAQTAVQQQQYEEAIRLFEQLKKDYGNTLSAVDATIGLADAYFQTGKPAEARAVYQEFLDEYEDNDEILTISARAGIAACQEQEGQYLEAAGDYQQLAEKYPDSFLAPQFLLDAGRCYQAAENPSQAKTMYDKVISMYEDTRYVQDARAALAAL